MFIDALIHIKEYLPLNKVADVIACGCFLVQFLQYIRFAFAQQQMHDTASAVLIRLICALL